MFGKTKYVDTLEIAENRAEEKLGIIVTLMQELADAEDAATNLKDNTERQISRLKDVVKKCEKVEKFVKGIMKK